MIRCTAQKAFVIYDKSHIRSKFGMRFVKNSNSTDIIRFRNKDDALYMKEVLNVAIARYGDWENAVKLGENDDLVICERMKNYMTDAVDFEYVDVKTYDDDDV
jgi:hypothetical protein